MRNIYKSCIYLLSDPSVLMCELKQTSNIVISDITVLFIKY